SRPISMTLLTCEADASSLLSGENVTALTASVLRSSVFTAAPVMALLTHSCGVSDSPFLPSCCEYRNRLNFFWNMYEKELLIQIGSFRQRAKIGWFNAFGVFPFV